MATYTTQGKLTYEVALKRLASRVFDPANTVSMINKQAEAIGLAYGVSGGDVLLCAVSEAAIASHSQHRDRWLSHYPAWCRGPGANHDDPT